jgi:23S rRNA pseudouridine1911/1915/1917 synthase
MTEEQRSYTIGDLVLYKNNQLIAFNKPATLPVQPDKSEDKSLMDLAKIYSKAEVHLIHRLDRPASGVVLFAKNKKALAALNEQFRNKAIEKTYLAVVKNKPDVDKGRLTHTLKKNKAGTKALLAKDGKTAELEYEVIDSIDNYHLLKIKLITGRFHQIRAQLAEIGCPIKGDVKYGFKRGNKDRSIHLHAWKLSFTHPVSQEQETITAPVPKDNVWDAFQF